MKFILHTIYIIAFLFYSNNLIIVTKVCSFVIRNSNNVLSKNKSKNKYNELQNSMSMFQQLLLKRNENNPISSVLLSSSPTTTTTSTTATTIEKEVINTTINEKNDENAFSLLSSITYHCIKESDKRRDASDKGKNEQPSSATNWIDEQSAFLLKQVMNKISLKLPEERQGYDRDEASIWLRWMKLSPVPLTIDISNSLRSTIRTNERDNNNDDNLLSRITCKLYILPSGMEMSNYIPSPAGSINYGKLLYGGVTRYRVLSSSTSNAPPRRTSERTAIKSRIEENIPCWIQYGGSNRNYQSLDIGPACILEIGLLPLHLASSSSLDTSTTSTTTSSNNDMKVDNLLWNPLNMFHFQESSSSSDNSKEKQQDTNGNMLPSMLSGQNRNEAFTMTFQSRVGGLQNQIEAIVRRVLDGRVIRPVLSYDSEEEDSSSLENEEDDDDEYFRELSNTKLEADELSLLGLSPVRGLLLYGPPGCGKTILAREISHALQARKPKIVSAPELLDRWVGGSERLIRDLFSDAEAELASVNGDASKSALHVIVIDEIDAVFRRRSSSVQQDSGEATRSSAVNQILAKLDGVQAIPNILVIGMTNRRELLDEALIRPGRLEVQIQIPLPNMEGRRDILKIHFDLLRKRGRLSQPLCMAIDGTTTTTLQDENNTSITTSEQQKQPITTTTTTTTGKKRKIIKKALNNVIQYASSSKRNNKHDTNNSYDLASDSITDGFSGADIAGLVRCAGSIALARARNDGSGIDGLLITLEDVKEALREVKGQL